MKNRAILPNITVITPSFNQGHYLEKTILSVVSQKYPNLQYLILDAGSTDSSLSIIKKYAKAYPQISWQSKPDKGQVYAINKGLQLAKGQIICYLNSDDYLLPKCLKQVVSYFKNNPDKLWVVGDCKVSNRSLDWTFYLKKVTPFHLSRIFLLLYNPINQPSVFLTKKLIKKVGKFDPIYKYSFDYDYWLRASKITLPGKINKKLALFRVHSATKSSQNYHQQFTENYKIARKNTKNKYILFSHKLFMKVIIGVYYFLKR